MPASTRRRSVTGGGGVEPGSGPDGPREGVHHVHRGAAAAKAVIVASKVNGAHVHEHEGGRAHDAWLHRHVKLALRQQRFQPARFRAEGGVAQVVEGNDLGVPRRVLLDVGAVVASSHDGPVVHYDAADRHLILVQCTLRLQKGRAHECVLLQGEGRVGQTPIATTTGCGRKI